MSHLIVDGVDKTLDHIYVNTGSIVKEAWEARDKNDHLLWGRADTFTGTNSISARCYGLPVKSWEIDGNSQQTGTPAPDDPVYPDFVGERTKNLLQIQATSDTVNGVEFTVDAGAGTVTLNGKATQNFSFHLFSMEGLPAGEYYLSGCPANGGSNKYTVYVAGSGAQQKVDSGSGVAFTNTGDYENCRIYCYKDFVFDNLVFRPMIRDSTETSGFEPYGYKLSITSAGQTVSVYLGQVQTLRRIKKLVLTGNETVSYQTGSSAPFKLTLTQQMVLPETSDIFWCCSHFVSISNAEWSQHGGQYSEFLAWHTSDGGSGLRFKDTAFSTANEFIQYLSDQYAAGMPVCVWYVLATPETGIINEPLCKIDTYTDTLTSEQAGITIPTTDGSTTISVDTSLAPSRFEIKVHAKAITP